MEPDLKRIDLSTSTYSLRQGIPPFSQAGPKKPSTKAKKVKENEKPQPSLTKALSEDFTRKAKDAKPTRNRVVERFHTKSSPSLHMSSAYIPEHINITDEDFLSLEELITTLKNKKHLTAVHGLNTTGIPHLIQGNELKTAYLEIGKHCPLEEIDLFFTGTDYISQHFAHFETLEHFQCFLASFPNLRRAIGIECVIIDKHQILPSELKLIYTQLAQKPQPLPLEHLELDGMRFESTYELAQLLHPYKDSVKHFSLRHITIQDEALNSSEQILDLNHQLSDFVLSDCQFPLSQLYFPNIKSLGHFVLQAFNSLSIESLQDVIIGTNIGLSPPDVAQLLLFLYANRTPESRLDTLRLCQFHADFKPDTNIYSLFVGLYSELKILFFNGPSNNCLITKNQQPIEGILKKDLYLLASTIESQQEYIHMVKSIDLESMDFTTMEELVDFIISFKKLSRIDNFLKCTIAHKKTKSKDYCIFLSKLADHSFPLRQISLKGNNFKHKEDIYNLLKRMPKETYISLGLNSTPIDRVKIKGKPISDTDLKSLASELLNKYEFKSVC